MEERDSSEYRLRHCVSLLVAKYAFQAIAAVSHNRYGKPGVHNKNKQAGDLLNELANATVEKFLAAAKKDNNVDALVQLLERDDVAVAAIFDTIFELRDDLINMALALDKLFEQLDMRN